MEITRPIRVAKAMIIEEPKCVTQVWAQALICSHESEGLLGVKPYVGQFVQATALRA